MKIKNITKPLLKDQGKYVEPGNPSAQESQIATNLFFIDLEMSKSQNFNLSSCQTFGWFVH